ncbi:hypothetical protein BH11MYX3_BH11MYX3_04120 [soil metagenome]
MIEATCSACGTLNRIAEADVAAGARFVNCSSCKSRVALPAKAGVIPAIPRPPLPKMPPPTPKGPPPVAVGVPSVAPVAGGKSEIDLSDLPAPKRQSPLADLPAPKSGPRSALSSSLGDLPAPRAPASVPPPMSSGSLDLDDLMGGDLPAPKAQVISDLPTPKARAATPPPAARAESAPGVADLPAPKNRTPTPRPAPRQSTPPVQQPAPRGGDITDLPAPKHGITDLPAPKPGGPTDLMTPKGGRQQPAAARSLDLDLPTPSSSVDLPAPKGFFDDLPQPSHGGRGSDRADVPAPKGFFDDLPQPARNRPAGEDIAPKGFFDDLPGRTNAKGQGPEVAQVPAPKGFFDDLPQPARAKKESTSPGNSISLDLGSDDEVPDMPLELEEQPELHSSSAGSFDDLDLSKPTTGPSATPASPGIGEEAQGVVRFGASRNTTGQVAKVPERAPLPSIGRGGTANDGILELEEPKAPATAQKLQPKRAKEAPVDDARAKASRAKRSKVMLGAVLGLALAGGGGYFFYQRHAASQARADEIDTQMTVARKALVAEDASHWQRAVTSATRVIELDATNGEALGIAAEASFAGAMADGKQQTMRFARGQKLINDALSAGVTGPQLNRAQALATLTTQPDKAVPKLEQMLAAAPKDGTLALYLGWAQSAAGDHPAAIKSFDQAMAATPSLKALALDGRARAKLAQTDVEGARADFNEILTVQKDNIAAQVGLASTLPQSQTQQQEADLLAILERKDIDTADPRAVVAAYVLAGKDALRGRRLDAARERFRKALTVEPRSVSAMTGLAETELRDRKFEIANEQITKALTIAKDDVQAHLVAAEIELKLGRADSAAQRLQLLADRKPPLPPLDQATLKLITGRMLEDQGKDEAAVDAYAEAAKLAGDFDLTPTMAAIAKLSDMARKAAEAQNPAKEAELKTRAEQLLSALADKAQTDPQLAMTLGVAYLQSGDPAKAEPWLRRVVEARNTDADALYQYGKALGLLGKFAEAIENLKKARELASARTEIGLELAITYERNKNDIEAGKLYDELVARDDATIETRAHAGKFYVRTKQIAKAGEQGTKIVAADPQHAAGHFLKAEGLFSQGRFDDARKEFGEAVSQERDPMYLDGQGRATEALALERNKDSSLFETALRAYLAATEIDPLMFSPLLGEGRIYVARREHAKALGPLLAASTIRADDAEIAYLLGVSYKEIGQKKDLAIQWLDRSLRLEPSGEAAWELGELYTDEGVNKPGQAQAALAQAVRLGINQEKMAKDGAQVPWLSKAMHLLGRVALDRGDEVTAKAAWEKWLVRPGSNKTGAKYDEVKRHMLTTLRSVGPPPPETP